MNELRDPAEATGDALLNLIDKAHEEMCAAVKRQWNGDPAALKLSIPCRPFDDTDALICGVLRAAKRELKEAMERRT